MSISQNGQTGAVDSFAEIMQYAIEREVEEYYFYTDLAARVDSAEVREMMLRHAQEEDGHRRQLEEILSNHRLPAIERQLPESDLKIADYLIPNERQQDHLSYQDALILAIKREQASANLYEDLGRFAEERQTRRIFQFLASQEKHHKEMLEKEYDDNFLDQD